MPETDPRLRMFLDEWEQNVRAGRTVAAMHERFDKHELHDDKRFDDVADRLERMGETLARDAGRREGEQTGRYRLVNGNMVREDASSYSGAIAHERRDSFRPARAIARALLSPKVFPWILLAVGTVAGALIRHCAPGLAGYLPPPTILAPPAASAASSR